MDQIRTALAWMNRHHFWLLGALVPLVALGAWYMGASYLQDETKTGIDTINAAFSTQQKLGSQSFYPNEDVNTKQKEQILIQAEQVKQIWQQLYDRQRELVLKWPAELGKRFADYMQNRNFGDSIRDDMRDAYQNYARQSFGGLPAIVGAKEVEEDPDGGGFGGGFGRGGFGGEGGFRGEGGFGGGFGGMEGAVAFDPTMDDGSLVRWHDQAMVKSQLMFDERPTSIKIWVTQEDLWVYETLLKAIAATNEEAGSDRYSNAAVRDIFSLEVGKLAAKESRTKGRIKMRTPAAGVGPESEFGGPEMGEMPMDDRGMMGEDGFNEFGGNFGDGPMTEEQERQLLLTDRYIDGEGKPIAMTASADGGSLDLSAFGVEYKRLPVRMVLQMDQRWLSFLIAQLASAPLQVEVQEVRINPQSVGSAGGGMMGGGFDGEGGGRGGFGGEGGFGGGNESVAIFERQPTVTTIVIQGTIYIFNKPDESQLQPEGAEGAVDPSLATVGSPEQGVIR